MVSDRLTDQHDNNSHDNSYINFKNFEYIEKGHGYGSSVDDNATFTCAVVVNTRKVPHNSNSNTSTIHATSSNTTLTTTEGSEDEAYIITQALFCLLLPFY